MESVPNIYYEFKINSEFIGKLYIEQKLYNSLFNQEEIKMRAVVIGKITVAEEIELTEVPIPKVKSGWVLVKVKAFGLNHSEQILRHQEIEAA